MCLGVFLGLARVVFEDRCGLQKSKTAEKRPKMGDFGQIGHVFGRKTRGFTLFSKNLVHRFGRLKGHNKNRGVRQIHQTTLVFRFLAINPRKIGILPKSAHFCPFWPKIPNFRANFRFFEALSEKSACNTFLPTPNASFWPGWIFRPRPRKLALGI